MTKNLLVIRCSLFASEVRETRGCSKITWDFSISSSLKENMFELVSGYDMMFQTYVHGISIEHRFVQIATHAIRDSWTKNQISWPGQLPAILSQLIFVLGSLHAIIHCLIKPSFLHRPSTKLYERNLIRDHQTIWSGTDRFRSFDPCTSFCFIRFEPVTFEIMIEAKLRFENSAFLFRSKYRNSEQNAA